MKTQLGTHLIDVLISYFLLSIALLGLDSMLIKATKETSSLFHLHVAIQQIMQIHDQLQMTNEPLKHISEWNKQNQQILPNGHGELDNKNKLFITWQQGRKETCLNNIATISCLMLDTSNTKKTN